LLKRTIKKVIYYQTTYSAKEIIGKIKAYEYISFDIFDTLIRRCLENPRDLFEIVAIKYNEKQGVNINPSMFKTARIDAYIRAKEEAGRSGRKEITLDDIYIQLAIAHPEYESLKHEEVEQEILMCHSDPILHQVFDWCVENKKHIVLASDMYLAKADILKILENCGYAGFDELYVSSDVMLKKSEGDLFRHITKDLSISPEKMIHIGDNIKSDYLQARKSKIKAVLVANEPFRTKYTRIKRVPKEIKKDIAKLNCIMSGFVSDEWNEYYQYGFEVLGPLLFGYSKWIHNTAMENKLNSLVFLARDGKLLQKAYNALYQENALCNDYIHVSRNAMTKALIWKTPDLSELLRNGSRGKWNCEMLCRRLGIEAQVGLNKWEEVGLDKTAIFSTDKLLENQNVQVFYDYFKENIVKESLEQYENVVRYLKGYVNGNVGIVDIGWAGTIQKCIDEYISFEKVSASTVGLYISVNEKLFKDIKIHSFIDKKERVSEYTGGMVEFPFTTKEGTTDSYYISSNGNVKPKLLDNEYAKNIIEPNVVEQIQRGALDFIAYFLPLRDCYNINSDVAYWNLKQVTKKPRLREVNLFGDLLFYNDVFIKLASPQSLFFYFLHPKLLIKDLRASGWKQGFVKKLLRVPLPYDKLLSICTRKKNED